MKSEELKKKKRKSFIQKAVELGLVERCGSTDFPVLVSTSTQQDVTDEWEELIRFVKNKKPLHVHIGIKKTKCCDEARHDERETLSIKLESLLIHVKGICAKKGSAGLSVQLSLIYNLRKLMKELKP